MGTRSCWYAIIHSAVGGVYDFRQGFVFADSLVGIVFLEPESFASGFFFSLLIFSVSEIVDIVALPKKKKLLLCRQLMFLLGRNTRAETLNWENCLHLTLNTVNGARETTTWRESYLAEG